MAMALVVGQGVSRSPSKPDLTSPRIQLNTFSLAQFVDPLPRLEIAQSIGHRPSPDNRFRLAPAGTQPIKPRQPRLFRRPRLREHPLREEQSAAAVEQVQSRNGGVR